MNRFTAKGSSQAPVKQNRRAGPTRLERLALRRQWKKFGFLAGLGFVIGSAQFLILKRLYGLPSVQSLIIVALLLAIGDFLYAWNVERTTRREGPDVWNSIVGREGKVVSAVGRHRAQAGTVRIEGEIWKAHCRQATAVLPGEKVRVTAREGLVLRVEPLASSGEKNTGLKQRSSEDDEVRIEKKGAKKSAGIEQPKGIDGGSVRRTRTRYV